jgi:hypothetical protein
LREKDCPISVQVGAAAHASVYAGRLVLACKAGRRTAQSHGDDDYLMIVVVSFFLLVVV